MSYKLDIQDDLMSIQGLYGTYEASNNEKGGFMISVVLGSYVFPYGSDVRHKIFYLRSFFFSLS